MENREEKTGQKKVDQGTIKHLIGRLSICHDQHDHVELVTELYDLDILKEKAA